MHQPHLAAPGRAVARFGSAQLALFDAGAGEVLATLAREVADLVGADWAEVRPAVAGLPPLASYRVGSSTGEETSVRTELRVGGELVAVLVVGAHSAATEDLTLVRETDLVEALCATAAARLSERRAEPLDRPAPDAPDTGTTADGAGEGGPEPVGVARLGKRSDGAWWVLSANAELSTLVRRPAEALAGAALAEVIPSGEVLDPELLVVQSQPTVRRIVRADGSSFEAWVMVVAAGADHLLLVFDVEAQARRQQELERIAMTDPVTGLSNRIQISALLERCLREDPPHSVAVMLLDLDRFKNVNDSLGHQAGDQLLIKVAGRLRAAVPEGTVLARLGGDEFLLLMRGLDDVLDVHPVAYGLLGELAAPFDLDIGHRVASSVSIGVAIADEPDLGAGELIRRADLAMYSAKDLGGNRYALCDGGMLAEAESRLKREVVLRRGLDEGRLELRLQPIVELGSGKIREFEALVRLLDPEIGEVQPANFVPIAEETGLISQIDHWVIEASLGVLAGDRQLIEDSDVRIAVNISGRTLERPDFMSRLVVALQRHGVGANRLVIEITESCLLGDNRAILWTLNQLRARGALVAIDDFGTGYSALSYLQNFEVDLLKIDQSFVRRVSSDDKRGTRLVRSIVQLAHDLGLQVVAEGVEEPEQAELLRSLSCDLGQGWLYGRPLPPARYGQPPAPRPPRHEVETLPTELDVAG